MSGKIPFYTIDTLKSTTSLSKNFNLIRLEHFIENIEHLKLPHRHSFYSFILITAGTGAQTIDFKKYLLARQRLFLISPGQIHAWIGFHQVKGYILLFNDHFMTISAGKRIMSDWSLFKAFQPSYYDLEIIEFEVWNKAFEDILKELKNADRFTQDAVYYALGALMVRASRLYQLSNQSEREPESDILFAYQELIDKHFYQLKTPKQYAVKLNITPNYLNAICKKKSGKSAGELIRQRIILEAKRLLVHTRISVAEISFKLDFKDNSYFGKYFKKYVHITPAQFRSKNARLAE